jgi:hypothetical protein
MLLSILLASQTATRRRLPLVVQVSEQSLGRPRRCRLLLGHGDVDEVLGVDEVGGLKGKRSPDRVAVRHGHDDGSMTLGGRALRFVARGRRRARTAGRELRVLRRPRPAHQAVMDRMLAGVSTRNVERVGEPVGTQVEQTSSVAAPNDQPHQEVAEPVTVSPSTPSDRRQRSTTIRATSSGFVFTYLALG